MIQRTEYKGFSLVWIVAISLLLAVVIGFISTNTLFFVSAEPDITPPIVNLSSITITPNELFDGEFFTISLNATDDLSGIDGIWTNFKSPSTNQGKYIYFGNGEFNSSAGIYSRMVYINPFVEDGVWNLTKIEAYDRIGNRYYNDSLQIPAFKIKTSNFYTRCPDFSKSRSFNNRTINLSISPNEDGMLDSFNIFIPHFIQNMNYTLKLIKSGIVEKIFNKNNVNYIYEEWDGKNSSGIVKEGAYNLEATLQKNSTANFTYNLGQINVDNTPANYSVNISSYNLSYNSSFEDERNNISITLESPEDIYWNVSLFGENGDYEHDDMIKSKKLSILSWFESDSDVRIDFSAEDIRVRDAGGASCGKDDSDSNFLSNNVSYEENVCDFDENDYIDSDNSESYPTNVHQGVSFGLDNGLAKYTLKIEGYDSAGNKIESQSLNLSFYSTENIDFSKIFVYSITNQNSVAIADNNYSHGWNSTFFVSFPQDENKIIMKVSDWIGKVTNGNIITENNTIISYKGNNYKVGSNYSNSDYFIVSDEDSIMEGIQAHFNLLVKIPDSTLADSYHTSFSINSTKSS